MKVSHIYHHYYPVLGGLERVVQNIAEEQVKMGHEVHVVTSTHGSEGEPREETVNGVRIHRVRAIRLRYPDLEYPINGPQRVLVDSDMVHVHSQNSLFNIATAKRAKKIGKPVIIDFLALDYLDSHTNPLIRFFGGLYQERIQREAVKIANKAITLNMMDHRILKNKYALESKIVPHGIDEKYLRKPKDDSLFRERYDAYDGNVVTYIGRVHPSKGLDTLVEALPLVARDVDNFVVVIAGGGPTCYKEKLIKLAKKLGVQRFVDLLGYMTENEKMSLLDSSKVFVLPTRHFGEAYPLVIDEAYARGVPIVATQVGVLPLRVEHLETGMLVPPSDPKSLSKALAALLKDDDLLARIRERLRGTKELLLTWRQVCRMLGNIYDCIPAEPARRGYAP